ncbi:MAG: hypothetical protein IJA19_05830 [Clostridia bacterium]|nr:hypothetical protein [Clostridia bacterium]
MFTWKLEELQLYKECEGKPKTHIFECEAETSREDKIAFVDSLTEGQLSYVLGLIDKLKEEKDTLALDQWGDIKTVSLIAWIKRNDTKYGSPIISTYSTYGMAKVLGIGRYIQNDDNDYVDKVFHAALVDCVEKEKGYFLAHDEYSILKEKFRNRGFASTFGVQIFDYLDKMVVEDDAGNERPITLEELKELNEKCEQVLALIEKLAQETHITY